MVIYLPFPFFFCYWVSWDVLFSAVAVACATSPSHVEGSSQNLEISVGEKKRQKAKRVQKEKRFYYQMTHVAWKFVCFVPISYLWEKWKNSLKGRRRVWKGNWIGEERRSSVLGQHWSSCQGVQGPVGTHQVLWGYLLIDVFPALEWGFSPSCQWVPVCTQFWIFLGMGWRGLRVFFLVVSIPLCVLPTPWHHFYTCTVLRRRTGSRKVPLYCPIFPGTSRSNFNINPSLPRLSQPSSKQLD